MVEHVKSHSGSIYPPATANKISQVCVAVHTEREYGRKVLGGYKAVIRFLENNIEFFLKICTIPHLTNVH